MASNWQKVTQQRENGEFVEMQAPVVVSASRSTDIPAFYADWFFHRLDVGYSAWTNPFNGVRTCVSYHNTRFIVFWSKNPKPLLSHLPTLKDKGIGCYVQYTLNDYEGEGHERSVPPLNERIETFKRLVDVLGKGHVVWRFDPLMLTETIGIDDLLAKVEHIADQLAGYTEKLVFSFADIVSFRRVQSNLQKAGVRYEDWSEAQMHNFARRLSALNANKWALEIATCGERIDLSPYGVRKNHCVDDDLIIRLAHGDDVLMKHLKVEKKDLPQPDLFGQTDPIPEDAIILPGGQYATHGNNRDNGQREFCGCIKSKDIGEYNTCTHGCEYCYANASKEAAAANYRLHLADPLSETITGR